MGDGARVAVVTGGNRGIGHEVCRQLAAKGYRVILTARDADQGRAAAASLHALGDVETYPLDVTSEESIVAFGRWMNTVIGRWDVLVNNAGVLPDPPDEPSVFDADLEPVRWAFETNVLGPLQLIQLAVPMMKERGYGRIANVSTGMASLTDMDGQFPAYRISKVSLNALTRIVCAELGKDSPVKVNSVCPGWVQTDMGGPSATRPVADGASGIVWAATLDADGPTGGFYRDGEPVAW